MKSQEIVRSGKGKREWISPPVAFGKKIRKGNSKKAGKGDQKERPVPSRLKEVARKKDVGKG